MASAPLFQPGDGLTGANAHGYTGVREEEHGRVLREVRRAVAKHAKPPRLDLMPHDEERGIAKLVKPGRSNRLVVREADATGGVD